MRISTKKVVIVIISISLLGKCFGFLRELLLAYYFGTSGIVDVYLMSVTIPSILFGFLPALGTGFTPVYFEIKENGKRNQFLNNILAVSVIIAVICIGFTVILSKQIVAICAFGFDLYSKKITSQFLAITIWAVLFNTPVQILTAYLNCNGDYINSNISNLFVSIIQASFIIIAAKAGDVFLPIGVVLPWPFQLWWLGNLSRKRGYRFVKYKKNDEYLKEIFKLAFPLFISNILVDINGFVDKMLSSFLPEGRMAALNYSFTLRAVFVTTSSTVIATVIYPKVAEKLVSGDKEAVQKLIAKYLDIITFIIVPICFICCVFSEDIVRIIFMRGNFDQDSLMNTVFPFLVYMLSLVVLVWRELIIRIMYSDGRTAINLKYSIFEISINIVLSLILVNYYEHVGLAIATTVAAILVFPLYIRELCRVISKKVMKERIRKFGIIMAASIVFAIISSAVSKLCVFGVRHGLLMDILRLAISISIGGIAYIVITYVLRVDECMELCAKIRGSR